jgi:4-diphosphocytidyl-2-C-methyl-D-erythritol kinase
MIQFPHCKINLGLQVLSKRTDGYHDIETCFYPVSRTDILEVIPSNELSFTRSGIDVPGEDHDNLCLKAYHLIRRDFGIGSVKIHLHKIIPIGAGLGGGSSDAAFTLRLLNEIFDLKISNGQMKNYALEVGSDCPFFIDNQPMMGTGRGEILNPVSLHLKGLHLILIKPDIHISTAEAYGGIIPQQREHSILNTLSLPIREWKDKLKNNFEDSIFNKHPSIGHIKEKLYSLGATYASMSGSGASVFGIFEKQIDLKNHFEGMDYWSGELK